MAPKSFKINGIYCLFDFVGKTDCEERQGKGSKRKAREGGGGGAPEEREEEGKGGGPGRRGGPGRGEKTQKREREEKAGGSNENGREAPPPTHPSHSLNHPLTLYTSSHLPIARSCGKYW